MAEEVMPEVGALSHQGQRRDNNEDRLATPPPDLSPQVVDTKGYLYIVADGMGGHQAGEKASEIVTATAMAKYYGDPSAKVSRSLGSAVESANAAIYHQARDPAYAGMGTTIVAAVIQGDRLTIAHVGDSRAFVLGRDGLRRVTQDHSWTAALVQDGLITESEADQHPQRHKLTRAVGLQPEVQVDIKQVTLAPGDQVLLCSDGLWDVVGEREIEDVLRSQRPQAAAKRLIERANELGGPDNIALIIVQPQPGLATPVAEISPWWDVRAWPRTQQILGAAAALLALVLICAGLYRLAENWMLPQAPAPEVSPVGYTVLPGDTRAAIAHYFQAPTDTLPADVTPGQTVPVTPGHYGLLLGGQVLRVKEDDDRVELKLGSRSPEDGVRRDEVVCDLLAGEAWVDQAWAPRRGDRVAVFGYPGEDGTIEAAVVDVEEGDGWRTWYFRPQPSPVWVYTAYDNVLLPPPGPQDDGQQVLARGTWARGGMGMVLNRDPEDLFVLVDGVYASSLTAQERQSLTQRLAPAPASTEVVMAATATPPLAVTPTQPRATALPEAALETDTQEPAETPAKQGTAAQTEPTPSYHKVRKEPLSVHVGPDTKTERVGILNTGDEVQVLCRTRGEKVEPGKPQWYRISYAEDRSGYIWAHGTVEGVIAMKVDRCQ